MTLKKVLYRTRVHITGSWKKALMMHPLVRVVFISLLAAQVTQPDQGRVVGARD